MSTCRHSSKNRFISLMSTKFKMMTDLKYGPRLRLDDNNNLSSGKTKTFSGVTSSIESIKDYSAPESDLRNVRYYPHSHLATPQSELETVTSSTTLGSHWKPKDTTTTTYSSDPSTLPNKTNRGELYNMMHQQHDEIKLAIGQTGRVLDESLLNSAKNLCLIETKTEDLRDEMIDKIEKLEDENDEYLDGFHEKMENFLDIARESIELVDFKRQIAEFVENNSQNIIEFSNTALMLESNTRRLQNAKNLLDFAIADLPDLTVFEHEDHRIYQVLAQLQTYIRSLPLNSQERQRMEECIKSTDQNQQFDGKYKCETIFREFMKIMSGWDADTRTQRSMNSQNMRGVFDTSSFSLSDSNLSDLQQELNTSQVRMAVQGPRNCIEISPWSTASDFSYKTTSDERSSIQSLREISSLSSYELKSSSLGSTSYSSILSDQPESDMRTACSPGSMVVPMPPRDLSQNEKHITVFTSPQTLQSATINSDTLSFPSATIDDSFSDSLTTAKFEENLSSENESDTQPSKSADSVRTSAEHTAFSH